MRPILHTEEAGASAKAVEALVHDRSLKRATVYLDPKLVVKATRQRKYDAREKAKTILVTIGRPNYLERKFVAQCKKAGMAFPLKQVQLKAWPIPRAKRSKRERAARPK